MIHFYIVYKINEIYWLRGILYVNFKPCHLETTYVFVGFLSCIKLKRLGQDSKYLELNKVNILSNYQNLVKTHVCIFSTFNKKPNNNLVELSTNDISTQYALEVYCL